ncbi:hypothetical protein G7085_01325 [Tessaracoccus sp. HDW20]|uniref:hypothetical protein n=1 Tax=Tessaracoccus coleopterorum TaxID=2714950 RepID=UPI0018D4CE3D|nr:hypothetical protein [Tessaracoccus coleopterorum]NHB83794.1 hypothetical protein [Tessaracoccus coleopterorum]
MQSRRTATRTSRRGAEGRRRRRWPRVLAVLTVLALLGGGALVRGTWEVRNTRLNEARFVTDELVSELRVVQVTDFHNIARPAQVRDIVELVRGPSPT